MQPWLHYVPVKVSSPPCPLIDVSSSARADSALLLPLVSQVDYGDLYDIMTFVSLSLSPLLVSAFLVRSRRVNVVADFPSISLFPSFSSEEMEFTQERNISPR